MSRTNKMYMVAQLAGFSLTDLQQEVLDWLSLVRILTTPKTFQWGTTATADFDLKQIEANIQQLSQEENLWLKLKCQGGEFQLHIANLTLFMRNIVDTEIYSENALMIEDYFDTRVIKNGVYAQIRSLDEYLYNNVEKIEKRKFDSEEEIANLPKRYNNEKEIVIDCNQLAGYDVDFRGLSLTSCWKMYYSSIYFQIIPKQVFLEVQQVQKVEELEHEIVKITLFNSPENWEMAVNKNFQRLFRDQMGFDQLAWNNGVGVLRAPYIEFAFVDDMIQTVQYQNDQLQPVEKKSATNFVTRSYDYVHKRYLENRTKGMLNAQAYFPWIDQKSRKMMNYRVLNPDLAIDGGVSAYEFYIRQFLEINILDDNYDTFTSVLRFYLPKESVQKLPLQALQEKLKDVTISNLEQKEVSTYFDLKKSSNHLRVVFLDYSYLDSVNQTVDAVE